MVVSLWPSWQPSRHSCKRKRPESLPASRRSHAVLLPAIRAVRRGSPLVCTTVRTRPSGLRTDLSGGDMNLEEYFDITRMAAVVCQDDRATARSTDGRDFAIAQPTTRRELTRCFGACKGDGARATRTRNGNHIAARSTKGLDPRAAQSTPGAAT